MHYGTIKQHDIANGPGIRVSLFVSGCSNRCEGCFQPQTWDKFYGTEYTNDTKQSILSAMRSSIHVGLTILGGEPFEVYNQPEIADLIKNFRDEFGDTKNIWMYTGFLYQDLLPNGKQYLPNITDTILDHIDVLVDGPFVLAKRNLMLKFRGSENQRIIDMRATRNPTSTKGIDNGVILWYNN